MKDDINEEDKDFATPITQSSKTLNSCDYCIQILDEIRSNMQPYEAQEFSKCVIDIEQNDGHEIFERF